MARDLLALNSTSSSTRDIEYRGSAGVTCRSGRCPATATRRR
jgi:hypothetical protein